MRICEYPTCDCEERRQRCLAGDKDARNEFVRTYGPLVAAIVRRILGRRFREEWEDASQEVLYHIETVLDRWDGQCPFCKWLPRVIANKSKDVRKQLIRCRAPFDPDGNYADPVDWRSRPLSPAIMKSINQAYERFPETHRRVYDLLLDEMTQVEIARTLKVSIRAVGYWVAEIRTSLRRCIDE